MVDTNVVSLLIILAHVTGKLVNWDSDTGELLQYCLLQSTNHINFCIGSGHSSYKEIIIDC